MGCKSMGEFFTPAAVHTVELRIVAVLVAALLVKAHLELHLPEGTEVLGGANPSVTIRVII